MGLLAQTGGERLFVFLRDHVLPSDSRAELAWASLEESLQTISGTSEFRRYLRGAVAVLAVRRLVCLWADEDPSSVRETMRVARAVPIARELFPGLPGDLATGLARHLTAAWEESNRSISATVHKRVLGSSTSHHCYLCGQHLDSTVTNHKDPRFLTLDHIWPSSLGGDSIDENLLPACSPCQQTKRDSPSWEWTNAHNVMLRSKPSADSLEHSLNRSQRIALHLRLGMERADQSRQTLKSALRDLGPVVRPLRLRETLDRPATLFDLLTTAN